MEWPWQQFDLWPRRISPEELQEELDKAKDEEQRINNRKEENAAKEKK